MHVGLHKAQLFVKRFGKMEQACNADTHSPLCTCVTDSTGLHPPAREGQEHRDGR
jgi:hypothetical protein